MVHRLGEMYFQTDFGHTRWQPMRPTIMRIIHSRRTRTPLVVPSTTISRAELDLAKYSSAPLHHDCSAQRKGCCASRLQGSSGSSNSFRRHIHVDLDSLTDTIVRHCAGRSPCSETVWRAEGSGSDFYKLVWPPWHGSQECEEIWRLA